MVAKSPDSIRSTGGYRGIPLTPEARQAGCERRTAIADKRAALAGTIAELQAAGAATPQSIADGLNRAGIPTASGRGESQPVQVSRVLARIAE
jgi:hypothetical protein